jgi:lantibiotic modifying enzyme
VLQRAGNAGTILFFRELVELTHEQSYREIALTGAAYIAAQVERITTFGLYRGLAGIAFALDQVKRLSEDCSLLDALDLAIGRLGASAKEGHPGVQWNDSNDLFSGTAGIGLALVHLVRGTGRKDLLELAKGPASVSSPLRANPSTAITGPPLPRIRRTIRISLMAQRASVISWPNSTKRRTTNAIAHVL